MTGAKPATGTPLVAGEFATGWRLVAASCVGLAYGMTSMGITYTIGSFLKPLTLAFGWSRQEILSVTILATIAIVPSSLAAGWLIDRHGARRLIVWSQLAFGLNFIALGCFTHSLVGLYVGYFIMPIAGIGTTPVAFSKVIARHFVARRGLALGIVLAGTGLCALTMPALLAQVIGRWDWRVGYVAAGLVSICVAAPLSWGWIRETGPAATADPPTGPDTRPGSSLVEALMGRRFWIMALAFLCVSGSATGLLTNLVPLINDRGYAASVGASAVALFGIAVIAGRLAVGGLVDRLWAPLVGLLFLMPAGAAVLLIAEASLPLPWLLTALAVAGLATGAELDLCAYLASRYFGVRHFGKIYGALFIALAAGGAVAGPVFGWIYDHYGSYGRALIAAGIGYLACGLLLPTLGRYPQTE